MVNLGTTEREAPQMDKRSITDEERAAVGAPAMTHGQVGRLVQIQELGALVVRPGSPAIPDLEALVAAGLAREIDYPHPHRKFIPAQQERQAPQFADKPGDHDPIEYAAVMAIRDAGGDVDRAIETYRRRGFQSTASSTTEEIRNARTLARHLEDVRDGLEVKWPSWTAEYQEYAAKLRAELKKWAAGELS